MIHTIDEVYDKVVLIEAALCSHKEGVDMARKITLEEQQEIEDLIRDEIAERIRQFGENEYLAADEIIRYLESIGYRAKSYDD